MNTTNETLEYRVYGPFGPGATGRELLGTFPSCEAAQQWIAAEMEDYATAIEEGAHPGEEAYQILADHLALAASCGREWADQASYDKEAPAFDELTAGDCLWIRQQTNSDLEIDAEMEAAARKAYDARIAVRRALGEVR